MYRFLKPAMPYLRSFVLALTTLFLSNTSAQTGWALKPTEAELSILPKYCLYVYHSKYGIYHSESKKWQNLIGPSFFNLHHYCWALLQVQRSEKLGVSPEKRRSLLNAAKEDIEYVLRRDRGKMILLPEIHTRLGRIEARLGNEQQAEASFSVARELKPDYWPVYFHWSEYLANANRIEDAINIVQAGMIQAPDSKQLTEQLKYLQKKLGRK